MIECSQILNNVTLYAETLDEKIQELESVKDNNRQEMEAVKRETTQEIESLKKKINKINFEYSEEIESLKEKINKINFECSKLINDVDKSRQNNIDLEGQIKTLQNENMKLKDNVSNSRSEISDISKTNEILIQRLHETQEEYLQTYSASIEKNNIIADHVKLHKRNIKILSRIKIQKD